MNCQAVQNKILALPDPRRVPAALLGHVAECPGCRTWVEQVARLESLLERLPTPLPPAGKKNALIDDVTRGTPATMPAAAPSRDSLAIFIKRNAMLVASLAAALLVAIGWWALSGTSTPPKDMATRKDPFLDKVVQCDVALANADTPAKKLQVLGGLADDVSGEARALARVAGPEDLQELARLYERTVKSGLLKQAEKITTPFPMTPAEMKAEFAALSSKLGATATETEKTLGEVSPEAKAALQRIAETARDGQKTLAAIASKKGV